MVEEVCLYLQSRVEWYNYLLCEFKEETTRLTSLGINFSIFFIKVEILLWKIGKLKD